MRTQIRTTEGLQEAARRATVQTGEALDVAIARLAQLQADGVDLATEHREAAQQVARTVRANTPAMSTRVPFTADGSMPVGEVETFLAALTDTFIARAMAELARTDPDLAAELEEGMQSAVAIIVAELPSQRESGTAGDLADKASTVGTVFGWISIGAAVVGGVVLLVGSGGTATPIVVGGLAAISKGAGVASMAAGSAEVVAGLVAGEGEHVLSGGLAIVTGKGLIPLVRPGATSHLDDLVAGSAQVLGNNGANSVAGMVGTHVILAPAPDATMEDITAEVQSLLPAAPAPPVPSASPTVPHGPPSLPTGINPLSPLPGSSSEPLPPGNTPVNQLPPSVILQSVQSSFPHAQVAMPSVHAGTGPPCRCRAYGWCRLALRRRTPSWLTPGQEAPCLDPLPHSSPSQHQDRNRREHQRDADHGRPTFRRDARHPDEDDEQRTCGQERERPHHTPAGVGRFTEGEEPADPDGQGPGQPPHGERGDGLVEGTEAGLGWAGGPPTVSVLGVDLPEAQPGRRPEESGAVGVLQLHLPLIGLGEPERRGGQDPQHVDRQRQRQDGQHHHQREREQHAPRRRPLPLVGEPEPEQVILPRVSQHEPPVRTDGEGVDPTVEDLHDAVMEVHLDPVPDGDRCRPRAGVRPGGQREQALGRAFV